MKRHSSTDWCKYLGIEVIDDDGWRSRGQTYLDDDKLTAEEFRDRWHESTVVHNTVIFYVDRRRTFDFIM